MDESLCKTSSLTYAHMCPTGKNKIRVKLAAQGEGKLAHWQDTAEALKEMDTLFDSLNGPGRKDKSKSCGDNSDPTLSQFKEGMKTSLVQEISKSANGKCEYDSTKFVATLADLIEDCDSSSSPEPEYPILLRALQPQQPAATNLGKIGRLSPSLTCISICIKLLAATERCSACIKDFTSEDLSIDTALQMMREDLIAAEWQEMKGETKISEAVMLKLKEVDDLEWIQCPPHIQETKINQEDCRVLTGLIGEMKSLLLDPNGTKVVSKFKETKFLLQLSAAEQQWFFRTLTAIQSTETAIEVDRQVLVPKSPAAAMIEEGVSAGGEEMALLEVFEASFPESANEKKATTLHFHKTSKYDIEVQESMNMVQQGKVWLQLG
ncbi:Striatin-3 [Frankliniella fusca]|uniref:Striatin-3 n=1 Tax=Frankliniella fusca TaxID=407009 RepID=A0AAE1LU69_9NEOP|nr:Striatin-3 [Frankliniella fusca]